jgi:hypothetical protein
MLVEGFGVNTVSPRVSVAGGRIWCEQCHPEFLLLVEGFGMNTVSFRVSVAGGRIWCEHSVTQRFCCWWKDLV